MCRRFSRRQWFTATGLVAFVIGCGVWFACADNARAEIRRSSPNEVYYNYYAPAADSESVGATLYPCPRPVPARVGVTTITYPPLAPHEFMYRHHRTYRTYHDDAGPTRTSVRWR